MLKVLGTALQVGLLAFALTSCSESGQNIHELAQEKSEDVAQLREQLRSHVAADKSITERLIKEISDLRKVKTERFKRGGNWQEIDSEQAVLFEELKASKSETDRLMLELSTRLVDLNGLLGTAYSHCGKDANLIVENLILAPYKSRLAESKRLESLFWEKKWGYDELVIDPKTDLDCAVVITQVEQAFQHAKKFLSEYE